MSKNSYFRKNILVRVEIYTDGAAKGNPGNGGYGVVMKAGPHYKELSEGFRLTTNNRMELLAVIAGIESIKNEKVDIHVFSDSKYVVDSISKKWVFTWETKNFKGKKNVDLWKRYLPLHKKYSPTMHWVKGHAGHLENERCDELAVAASEKSKLQIDTEYEKVVDQTTFPPSN
ncbi:MAG: ribonuclease HI [Lentimonas sp.]|jgi:ribonuclease HI